MQFERFLDYKQKSIGHILGTFSFHFLTLFPLYVRSHHGLFNCTLILEIHC